MQGRKELTPKMLYQVHLQDLIPEQNYYRLLDKAIDFHFLYKDTAQYYGEEGQESIDPVVFFKISLVCYINNINSDRKLKRPLVSGEILQSIKTSLSAFSLSK